MKKLFYAAIVVLLLVGLGAWAQDCVDYQPNEMEILDSLNMSGLYAYNIQVEGDVAFVGTAYYLHTVDISDPANMQIMDTINYNALGMAVSNGMVCLAIQDDDVHFIDAADPANLVFVKTITGLDFLQQVAAGGDYFYVGGNHLGVHTFDATDRTNPVLASTVPCPERVVVLKVVGNVLYTTGYDADLCAFSLANPAQPVLGGISTSYYTGGYDIEPLGDYLFVGSFSHGLTVVRVLNPLTPVRITSIPVYGGVNTLTRRGNLLFAGCEPAILAFDVTNPESPLLVGRTVTGLDVWGLEPHGDHLIGIASDNFLFSLDASQPFSTLPLEFQYTDGETVDMAFSADHAFLANGNDGFLIRPIGSQNAVSVTFIPGFLHGVTLDGDLAYLPMDDYGLQIVDVSNPSVPVMLDDINTSGHARDVAVYHNDSGTYALVADTEYDLASYDATDPTWIRPKGITYFPGQVYDIEVSGDYALVADNSGALQVVDVSLFPSQPQPVATLELPGAPVEIWVQGSVAFVAGGLYLSTVDISDPLSPQLLGSVGTTSAVVDLTIKSGVAYLAVAGSGMDIIDVSDPEALVFMGHFESIGNPRGIAEQGGDIYLCEGDVGLEVMPLQCLLSPVGDLPGQQARYLGQAYPNPFNPRTTISYELPRSAVVDLRIYNLAGKLERTLLAGRQVEAGPRQVQWDGTDNTGRALPSGVYLYQLMAGQINETRRVVLLR